MDYYFFNCKIWEESQWLIEFKKIRQLKYKGDKENNFTLTIEMNLLNNLGN